MLTRPIQFARVFLVAAATIGCDRGSHDREAVARVDSILAASNTDIGATFQESLTDSEKVVILGRAVDAAELLRGFMHALPIDSTANALTPIEAADSVFSRFVEDEALTRSVSSFVWGELGTSAIASASIVLCNAKDPCAGSVEKPPSSQVTERPDLIAIDPPQIASFLAQNLRLADNAVVVEKRHKDASKRIALARCVNGALMLYYSPKIDARFSPIGFTFVRAHEYAHLMLGHVRCGRGGETVVATDISIERRELDADCEAAKIIAQKVPVGAISVISYSAGVLFQMNVPAVDGYPSSRARSDGLYRPECG